MAKKTGSYIGVTGFMSRSEVTEALAMVPEGSKHTSFSKDSISSIRADDFPERKISTPPVCTKAAFLLNYRFDHWGCFFLKPFAMVSVNPQNFSL